MINLILMGFSDSKQKSKFEEIYHTYKKVIYYIALKYLKSEQLAEEAVQEIFFKVFCNIEKVVMLESDKKKGYLMQIAKNTAIDIYRKEKVGFRNINKDEIQTYDIEDEFSLEKTIIKKEISRQINSSMNELQEMDRQILRLRYIEEKSEKEIAEILGLSYENTRTRIRRAKKKLANSLLEKKEDMLHEF